jgi:hypothetical protein
MKRKYMNYYKIKAMKREAALIIAAIAISFSLVSAQNPNRERLDAYKIAFFTKRMNLTSQEAEKFWPVYNENQNQRNQLQTEKQTLMRTFNQGESTMSDQQITELGNKYCEILVKESDLAVTFHKKLQDILPPAKIIRLYQAENQYRLQLLKELQDRRPLQQGNRPANQ